MKDSKRETESIWKPERLELAIEKKGITRKELSDRSGVTESLISDYLNYNSPSEVKKKRSAPRTTTVVKLADALGVDPSWLSGMNVPMNEPNILREQRTDWFSNMEKLFNKKYIILEEKQDETRTKFNLSKSSPVSQYGEETKKALDYLLMVIEELKPQRETLEIMLYLNKESQTQLLAMARLLKLAQEQKSYK